MIVRFPRFPDGFNLLQRLALGFRNKKDGSKEVKKSAASPEEEHGEIAIVAHDGQEEIGDERRDTLIKQ